MPRTARARTHKRFLNITERNVNRIRDEGFGRVMVDDQSPTGEWISVDGRKVLNFGSCAYLGLNVDPRLKEGAIAAIERFGPVYSSSTAYTYVDLYDELEKRLTAIFDAPVAIPATTTLGHLSALPVLVGLDDLVIVDLQSHASVQLATQVLRAQDVEVELISHNDVAALAARLAEVGDRHERVWYLADGIYSMYGDTAPASEIRTLLDEFPNLWVYYDDAHGVGWSGESGRGWVLNEAGHHERVIISASLAKSFGAGGAVLVVPDAAMKQRLETCGGTFIFSGPIHPAGLGAAVASTDIHLSAEHAERQRRLLDQIAFVQRGLIERRLPVMSLEQTPIWFLKIGSLDATLELTRRMLGDGFYVNPATYPAVPVRSDGVRFTQTLYHSDYDLEALLDAFARHVPDLVPGQDLVVDLRDA
jgi:7-keto-8-aminopelargonate synthetase-like enzyme